MYRRRRPPPQRLAFGFDSFLDLVANVIGVIVRLILVAWVGARAYTTGMQWVDEEPPPEAVAPLALPLPPTPPEPRPEDHPLQAAIEKTRRDLETARNLLASRTEQAALLRSEMKEAADRREGLRERARELETAQESLERRLAEKKAGFRLASLSVEELRRRADDLRRRAEGLEKQPLPSRQLRYHAPVSRPVQADELEFEFRAGRIAFIDLPAFLHEIQGRIDDFGERLRTERRLEERTEPVGPFRLRYLVEREGSLAESPLTGIRYGLTRWEVEPVAALRGETLAQALTKGSAFRRLVENLDPQQTVLTFWVYPESFAAFRNVRDWLYERGFVVAGRPLPDGAPIAASTRGTRARGQ